jgi:hypothetical protein
LGFDKVENFMAKLTEEQKSLLILMGKADDGSKTHIVIDGERITQDLIMMGLVRKTGNNSYGLTDKGERIYGELTGEEVIQMYIGAVTWKRKGDPIVIIGMCYKYWKNGNGKWIVDIDGDERECFSEQDAILIARGLLLDGSRNRDLLQQTLEANLRNDIGYHYRVTRMLKSSLDQTAQA